MAYKDIYARWQADPEAYWMEQAQRHRLGEAAGPGAG